MTAEPTADPSPSSAASPDVPQATETPSSFFLADGDSVVPTLLAASPWGPVLHGRMSGGLAARAVQQALAEDPDLVCTRLTIDMFKSAPLTPMQVRTRIVRSGRRIKVLEVTVEQDGVAIGQGKFVLLRRSEQPEGTFRETPGWAAPTPGPLLGRRTGQSSRGWKGPWRAIAGRRRTSRGG